MESRLFRYIFLIVILFVGLSMGNSQDGLQTKLDEFEGEIQRPYNDYSYIESEVYDTNVMNTVAKKSEKLINTTLDIAGDIVEGLFGTLFK